ncbi:DnaD domain-containing protein [Lederbergia lenta]|uniref:Primosome, DnaD subunit n=1 Tax=Lederbergia lenta TaxID=1467 RepID=A0A2X4VWF4_LEDLE|nr:DnaD domain-containing protein [Lederbergia lenta]MCM3109301.1 DnaD domain-containing protein [Lederbergia lenta]MEC2324933.1 DnaD domain-containing protein [Lederbergia lenta]SQI56607.1 primosome, DnaD subunit [Lederbergia lenta]
MDKEIMVSWIEEGMIHVPNLLMNNYRQIGLDEKELVVLLHIFSFSEKGNKFPTPEEISERMTITSSECASILRKLMQLGMIKIEEGCSEEEIRFERYSLTPLWIRLAEEMIREKKQSNLEKVLTEEQDLFSIFEQEFGRPLTPIECESLGMWMDQDGQDPVMIKAALRESVMSGKLNFRYIDRILLEWKKNGVNTVEQARVQGLKFRQKSKQTNPPVQNSNSVPFFNWLEQ